MSALLTPVDYSPAITRSTLLTIAAILVSAGGLLLTFVRFHISNVERFTRIETKVTELWDDWRRRRDRERAL